MTDDRLEPGRVRCDPIRQVASIGAVLGKALGSLDSGIGYIPVLVTLK